MQIAVCQRWEESESEPGWGVTIRDDGYSLHQSNEDCAAYIKKYWDAMPDGLPDGQAPSVYNRPYGNPYLVKVSDELFDKIKNGLRFYSKYCPNPNTEVDPEKAEA